MRITAMGEANYTGNDGDCVQICAHEAFEGEYRGDLSSFDCYDFLWEMYWCSAH